MSDFFLRDKSEVDTFIKLVTDNGILINDVALLREAIEYACQHLADEWLTLKWGGGENFICTLGQTGWSLPEWWDVIASLHELRYVDGLDEQARRLCIRSQESIATSLVIVAAGRFKRNGWTIAFEPNGKGCSDLRITKGAHFYVEVKRENMQSHKRINGLRRNASAILSDIGPTLIDWLETHGSRVQVKLSSG